MVNFGRRLKAHQFAPWKSHYLDYSKLKDILETETSEELAAFREREFVRQLNRDIEKIVLFFLYEQGQLAVRLSKLGEEERECSLEVRELAAHTGKEADTLTKLKELSQQYTVVGEDLIHLIHFVELNVTGVRKILKKHDKLYKGNKLSDRYLSEHYWETEDSHLRQLLHYEGVGALVATLQESLTEIGALERILQDSMSSRETTSTTEARHRRTFTAPGPLLIMTSPKAKPWKPGTPQSTTKSLDTFHEYLIDSSSSWQVPILLRIDAARRRLHESSNFVRVLAAGEMALMQRISSEEDLEAIEEGAFPRAKVCRISSFLNLMSR